MLFSQLCESSPLDSLPFPRGCYQSQLLTRRKHIGFTFYFIFSPQRGISIILLKALPPRPLSFLQTASQSIHPPHSGNYRKRPSTLHLFSLASVSGFFVLRALAANCFLSLFPPVLCPGALTARSTYLRALNTFFKHCTPVRTRHAPATCGRRGRVSSRRRSVDCLRGGC